MAAAAHDSPGGPDGVDTKHLAEQLEMRMRDLGLTKASIARNGGPSRSVLQRLGAKGWGPPSVQNLEKIDRVLQWTPGSAATTLRGGYPTPRETGQASAGRLEYDFDNLNHHIEQRLKQLRLNKTKLAGMGGPSRNTLATLGKRGYTPTRETFDRLDSFLQWEPGGALAALRGGTPTPKGMGPEHMAGIRAPAAGAMERLRAALRRLDRVEAQLHEGFGEMRSALEQSVSAIQVVIEELPDGDAPLPRG